MLRFECKSEIDPVGKKMLTTLYAPGRVPGRMRRNILFWILFVVLFLAMVWIGYLLRLRYISDNPTSSIGGWCCVKRGKDCQWRTSQEVCRKDGGIIFDVSRDSCAIICRSATSR